jgi:SAM-dependent methyltransferase
MHPSAYAWATSALSPGDVKGRHVAEAGAHDVNGSVRGHVEAMGPKSYTGTDLAEGPGVDRVLDAADYSRLEQAPDVLISTEMLEHAEDWQAAMAGMIRAVAPGGLLVITTRSEGFPYHGYPGDHWRFSVGGMGEVMAAAKLDVLDLRADPDPMSPGVFVKARKPEEWAWPRGTRKAWDAVEGVTAMTA